MRDTWGEILGPDLPWLEALGHMMLVEAADLTYWSLLSLMSPDDQTLTGATPSKGLVMSPLPPSLAPPIPAVTLILTLITFPEPTLNRSSFSLFWLESKTYNGVEHQEVRT